MYYASEHGHNKDGESIKVVIENRHISNVIHTDMSEYEIDKISWFPSGFRGHQLIMKKCPQFSFLFKNLRDTPIQARGSSLGVRFLLFIKGIMAPIYICRIMSDHAGSLFVRKARHLAAEQRDGSSQRCWLPHSVTSLVTSVVSTAGDISAQGPSLVSI